jgi:hypothetical protein
MTHITGPYITETIVTVECTVSSQEVLDLAAYWNLDFDGAELAEGGDRRCCTPGGVPTVARHSTSGGWAGRPGRQARPARAPP